MGISDENNCSLDSISKSDGLSEDANQVAMQNQIAVLNIDVEVMSNFQVLEFLQTHPASHYFRKSSVEILFTCGGSANARKYL